MKNFNIPLTAKEKANCRIINEYHTKNGNYLRVRKARSDNEMQNLGRFYFVDVFKNTIENYNVNPQNEANLLRNKISLKRKYNTCMNLN